MSLIQESQITLSLDGAPRKEFTCFDHLKEFDSAHKTFLEILRLNSEIDDVSLVFYDKDSNSDDGEWEKDQPLVWLPKNFVVDDVLEQIVRSNFENGSNLMAVGSKIKLKDGQIKHIPMMDFCVDSEKANADEVRQIAEQTLNRFSSLRGVLLKTDKSFHFWSPNLMSSDTWVNFMENREMIEIGRGNKSENPVCDIGFIKKSVERGFSGLRIFGYEGTDKKTAPYVVALTK